MTRKPEPARRLYAAAAVLLALLLLSLLNAWHADTLTDTLCASLDQAQLLAEADRWEGAGELTQKAFSRWKGEESYVYTMLRHADADLIERGFRQVMEYVKLREMDQYAAANADLITQLRLLGEMEQPSILNVL